MSLTAYRPTAVQIPIRSIPILFTADGADDRRCPSAAEPQPNERPEFLTTDDTDEHGQNHTPWIGSRAIRVIRGKKFDFALIRVIHGQNFRSFIRRDFCGILR